MKSNILKNNIGRLWAVVFCSTLTVCSTLNVLISCLRSKMKHSNKENISGFINFVVDIGTDVDEESRHTRSNIGKVEKWKLTIL